MNIGVLFIAAGLKVRMKIKGKALLHRDELNKAKKYLNEIFIWMENSDRKITPIIITPFDEIYELAVQNHIKAVRNDFATASEGSMIKFGINNFPEFDVYLIASAADKKVFKAEIFESICMHYEKNTDRIVFSKYENKLRLPIIFSGNNLKFVNSVISVENGKFVFRTNSKNSTFIEISDEIIEKDIYPRDDYKNFKDYNDIIEKTYSGMQNLIKHDFQWFCQSNRKKVVVIRGGGRIASAVAVNLHRFGYSVLITEKEVPETLFRENSFAKAVMVTKKKLGKTESYLVAMSASNLKDAWDNGVIPVVIDPDLKCLDILYGKDKGEDVFAGRNASDAGYSILNEHNEFKPPVKSQSGQNLEISGKYKLEAICDFTGPGGTKINKSMAPVTFGIYENHNVPQGPEYLIVTKSGPEFSRLRKNNPYSVERISDNPDEEGKESELYSDNKKTNENKDMNISYEESDYSGCFLKKTVSQAAGKFKEIRKIGDIVSKGDIIAQIETSENDKLDVVCESDGVIAGLAIPGNFYKKGSTIIYTAFPDTPKEVIEKIYPSDNAVALSVLNKLINSDLNIFTKNDNFF